MDKFHIEFYKWDDYKIFYDSCKKFLNLNDIQFYFPILSLYLYYHNTKYSHKKIDLDRRYFVKEILSIEYYSNLFKSTNFVHQIFFHWYFFKKHSLKIHEI